MRRKELNERVAVIVSVQSKLTIAHGFIDLVEEIAREALSYGDPCCLCHARWADAPHVGRGARELVHVKGCLLETLTNVAPVVTP